jgi:hypothetical protein
MHGRFSCVPNPIRALRFVRDIYAKEVVEFLKKDDTIPQINYKMFIEFMRSRTCAAGWGRKLHISFFQDYANEFPCH